MPVYFSTRKNLELEVCFGLKKTKQIKPNSNDTNNNKNNRKISKMCEQNVNDRNRRGMEEKKKVEYIKLSFPSLVIGINQNQNDVEYTFRPARGKVRSLTVINQVNK